VVQEPAHGAGVVDARPECLDFTAGLEFFQCLDPTAVKLAHVVRDTSLREMHLV